MGHIELTFQLASIRSSSSETRLQIMADRRQLFTVMVSLKRHYGGELVAKSRL